MEYLIYWGSAAAALAAIIAVARKPVKRLLQLLKELQEFLDDWRGHPPRTDASGAIIQEAEPGAMARLRAAEHELQHNGGGSVKDAVARIETSVKNLSKQQGETDSKLDEHIAIAKRSDADQAVDSALLHRLASRYLPDEPNES
ncbi:hypothetical protein [Zhihengliuella sp.]|uniref:hypothetical protein n=1 Tax=Zhihengliuella sp. TaxID=1954483 RepID=UPI00281243F4|nr:hypothetical protein [Zhihengliuella sp.]